ncbi:unnamed protein product [Symbiodinium sp. CCMP2592]|nr:unnamed protein product [Symbiodinium sp. CCMP2592]
MAPVNTSVAQALQLNNREWPMLTSEPEWELVSSSAKEMAFDEFPVDETETPSWAARLCAQKDKMTKPHKKIAANQALRDDKVASSESCRQVTEERFEDNDDCCYPDAKQLARESHCRQTGKGGRHTMRAKGHCPVRKNSEVSVVAACGAHPQDVSQLANILRQVPVREVVKQVGGACQEVKTSEGRHALLGSAKVYDVTVPVTGPTDDIDVTYRVIEEVRGGANRSTRNPKCSASHTTESFQSRSKVPECPQTRKQQTCKKDIQEGMNIMGFA